MPTDKLSLLYATFPDEKTAVSICEKLVQEKLIACANVLPPIRSIYVWKGKLENSGEVAALLKTDSSQFAAVEKIYRELHPYETPCLMEIPLGELSGPYADWLKAALQTP